MNQKQNISISLIIILFVILATLCTLFITGAISFNANNNIENTDTKVKNIIGTYSANFDNLKNDDSTFPATIILNLYENGVFTYTFNVEAPAGVLGNYTIDNNKIILTNWFNTGSDTGLRVTKGTKTLIINADGTITDNNIKNTLLINNQITSANLTKNKNQESFDLTNRLIYADFLADFLNENTAFEPEM